MPVRTHRGRAAVYRRLWGWPLRSLPHLAVAGAVGAAAVIVIGLATDATGGQSHGGLSDPADSPGYHPPATTSRDYSGDLNDLGAPTGGQRAAAPAAALVVADDFTQLWVHHPSGMTTAQWTGRLRPYTTEAYLRELAGVDPATVPAGAVTGPATVVDTHSDSGTATLEVDVPTDALILRLTVVHTSDGWRVADYTRADQ